MGTRNDRHWIYLLLSTHNKSLRRLETSSHTTIKMCGQRFIVTNRFILRTQRRATQSIGYFYPSTDKHIAHPLPSNPTGITVCVQSGNPTDSCGGCIQHGRRHDRHCNLPARTEGVEAPSAYKGGAETQCASTRLGKGRETASTIFGVKIRQPKQCLQGNGLPQATNEKKAQEVQNRGSRSQRCC